LHARDGVKAGVFERKRLDGCSDIGSRVVEVEGYEFAPVTCKQSSHWGERSDVEDPAESTEEVLSSEYEGDEPMALKAAALRTPGLPSSWIPIGEKERNPPLAHGTFAHRVRS
jgi:hypothetical protein